MQKVASKSIFCLRNMFVESSVRISLGEKGGKRRRVDGGEAAAWVVVGGGKGGVFASKLRKEGKRQKKRMEGGGWGCHFFQTGHTTALNPKEDAKRSRGRKEKRRGDWT